MERVKQELFREPQGGMQYWLLLGLGLVLTSIALVDFIASLLRGEPDVAWLNGIASFLFLVLAGMSELIPGNRRRTAAVLRVCAIFTAIAAIGLFVFSL